MECLGELGQDSRAWCPACAGVKKPKLDNLRAHARGLGGVCLAEQYGNSSEAIPWRCGEGHTWSAVAVARGGDCLSREYLGVGASYRWRCAEGHEWNAVAGNVKHGGWCPVCSGRHALGIEVLDALAREGGGVCLSRVYGNSQTHLRWRCAESHEWEVIPASIRRGSWCPVCALDRRVSQTERPRLRRDHGRVEITSASTSAFLLRPSIPRDPHPYRRSIDRVQGPLAVPCRTCSLHAR